VLTAVNDAAAGIGLRAGLSFADACAIHPALAWAESAPEQDGRLLENVAQWCERYTPLVGMDFPDGLFLDITGVAHLFGGEAALACDLAKRLATQGLQARIAVADTAGAAWAAARYAKMPLVPAGQTAAVLAPLPLAALRLSSETRDGLVQLGFKTIGDIMARPRAPLTARFGEALMQRLGQALGREDEPIMPRTPVPPLSVEQGSPEPLLRDEDILAVLARLEERLCALLESRGQGARRMLASFFGVDGTVHRLQVGASRPLRDAVRLHRLFTDKFSLAKWENEFGFDRIRLAVLEAESFAPSQNCLGGGEEGGELANLIDCLSARLGAARVLRLMPQDTHVPELESVAVPASGATEFTPPTPNPYPHWGRGSDQDSLAPPRPLRLFERPEPISAIAEIPDGPPVRFRWRRVAHDVVRVEGPERIAMPWWRDQHDRALTRDYFRVETTDGARLWLYREGLYEQTAQPRWFLHGFLP
jgi:protein ImuB